MVAISANGLFVDLSNYQCTSIHLDTVHLYHTPSIPFWLKDLAKDPYKDYIVKDAQITSGGTS